MSAATFGAPGGLSQAIGDQNTLSTMNARDAMLPGAIQFQQGQIAKQPAEIMNLLANSGLHMAEAGLKNEALRQAKVMSEAMSKMSQSTPEGQDPLDAMMNMQGNMLKTAMSSGNVDTAMKIANNYEQLVGHAATIQKNKLQAQHQEYQNRLDKLSSVGRVLNGVDDQASFDQAAQQWMQTFKEPAPFANPNNPNWAIPYHPEAVRQLQEKTLTYQQKLEQDRKDDALGVREADFERKKKLSELLGEIKQEQVSLAKQREERLAKGGGKVAVPSNRDVEDVKDFITTEDPRMNNLSGDNAKLFNIYSKSVAFEAKKIHNKNPGITYEEALGQAYEASKDQLDIVTSEPTKIPFTDVGIPGTGGTTTLKLKGKGMSEKGTRANPIVGPVASPEEGKYYTNNKGQLGFVRDGKVVLVQP